MEEHECREGAKVICVMTAGDHIGKVGIIYDVVYRSNGCIAHYRVKSRTGAPISSGYFSYLNSWDLHDFLDDVFKSSNYQKPLAKECPCGIHRADCDYHK